MSFDDTVEPVSEWVWDQSLILETLKMKEDQLLQEHGRDEFYCPYFEALMMMYAVNRDKGWSHELLLENLEGIRAQYDKSQS